MFADTPNDVHVDIVAPMFSLNLQEDVEGVTDDQSHVSQGSRLPGDIHDIPTATISQTNQSDDTNSPPPPVMYITYLCSRVINS